MSNLRKKVIRVAAVVVAAVTTLCGCSGNRELPTKRPGSSTTASKELEAPDEFELSKDNIDLVVWESDNGPDNWIKKAGEKFTDKNQNIKIHVYNVAIDNVVRDILSDSLDIPKPDIFGAPHDRIGEMVNKGLILPTVNPEAVASSTIHQATHALYYNDVMYGYPTSAETYALFYNKELIKEDELPETWEDVIEFSKSYNNEDEAKYALVFSADTIYICSMFFTYGGARITDEDVFSPDSANAIAGGTLMQKITSFFPSRAAEVEKYSYDRLFLEKKAAMIINGPWFLTQAETSQIDYGITTLPAFEKGGDPAVSFMGTRGVFVSSSCKYPNEAAAFCHFLISKDMQVLRHEVTMALPSVNIEVNDKLDGFIRQLEYSQPMPSYENMQEFWDKGEHLCHQIMSGTDVKQALEEYNNPPTEGDNSDTPAPAAAGNSETTAADNSGIEGNSDNSDISDIPDSE